MTFDNKPIGQKLRTVTLLVIGVVLIINRTAYFIYEFVSFQDSELQYLTTVGEIVANNSTAALAFDSRADAEETLSALKAHKNIVAAALYDTDGRLFAWYPKDQVATDFPYRPGPAGFSLEASHLVGYQPVIRNNIPLGVLYLKSDTTVILDRLMRYATFAVVIIGASFLFAILLANQLHRQITNPIVNLTSTAQAISQHEDYSVRAPRLSNDETGVLTDAFNQMLDRIEEQNKALHESSARVRAIIDSSLSAVVTFDQHGIITDWNRRAEDMFRWSKAEALGKDIQELTVPERYRETNRQSLDDFIAKGRATGVNRLYESTALRRDRTEFPVELVVSPLKEAGEYIFCAFVTDITERKKAEAQIKSFQQQLEQKVLERTRELEEANRELESFSYTVSHDLRAPLRSVHGYMKIFAEEYFDKLDEEGQRLVNTVLKNSKMMGQLIDDLLSFSRLGRKDIVMAPVSMEDLVKNIWDELVQHEQGREIELVLGALPDAHADISTIRQVWANLIANALKYTRGKEKAVITISSEDKPDEVIYYVNDNGAGFNMAYYDKLFGVFQRLHSQFEFEGTGVGLAIVNRIVQKHGGRVWGEGRLKEGATFFFSLKKNNGTA